VFLSTIVQTALIQLKPLISSSDSTLGIAINIEMLPAWAIIYAPVFVLTAVTVWFLKKKKK